MRKYSAKQMSFLPIESRVNAKPNLITSNHTITSRFQLKKNYLHFSVCRMNKLIFFLLFFYIYIHTYTYSKLDDNSP